MKKSHIPFPFEIKFPFWHLFLHQYAWFLPPTNGRFFQSEKNYILLKQSILIPSDQQNWLKNICLYNPLWKYGIVFFIYFEVDGSIDPWLFMVINFPWWRGPHVQPPTALLWYYVLGYHRQFYLARTSVKSWTD